MGHVTGQQIESHDIELTVGGLALTVEADHLWLRDGGAEHLVIGVPSSHDFSGQVAFFSRGAGAKEWELGQTLDPEASTRFDGSIGSEAGRSVILHELKGKAGLVAYVSAPFGGAFSSIHCFDCKTGDIKWLLTSKELPVDAGVVGQSMQLMRTGAGTLTLQLSRTRFHPTGISLGTYDRGGGASVSIDAHSGRVIAIN